MTAALIATLEGADPRVHQGAAQALAGQNRHDYSIALLCFGRGGGPCGRRRPGGW